MSKEFYRLWFEGDIGQERLLFTSYKAAREWFFANPHVIELAEQEVKAYPDAHSTVEEEKENLWMDCAGLELCKVIA